MEVHNKHLFTHMRNLRLIRKPPRTVVAERLFLENVAAYNVEIDVGDVQTSSIISLREVPSFLIDAFARIGQLDGYRVEGIFRREGAAARTKDGSLYVFFGVDPIPSTFLIHDVCSWIKRFFRDLKSPLFKNCESQLLKYAETFSSAESKSDLFAVSLNLIERLPSSHLGTLAFLMRCLQEVSKTANVHQMTVENLAMVFAPSIFRNQPCMDQKKNKKAKSSSRDNLMNIVQMKRTNELQALVIQVLIENAEKINVPKDNYKASRRPSDVKRRANMQFEKRENLPAMPSMKEDLDTTYFRNAPLKGSQSTSNIFKATQHSSSSLISHFNKKRRSDLLKADRNRSMSVVKVFGALKNYFMDQNAPDNTAPINHDRSVSSTDLFTLMKELEQSKVFNKEPGADRYPMETPQPFAVTTRRMKPSLQSELRSPSPELITPLIQMYSRAVDSSAVIPNSKSPIADVETDDTSSDFNKSPLTFDSTRSSSEFLTPTKRRSPSLQPSSGSSSRRAKLEFTTSLDKPSRKSDSTPPKDNVRKSPEDDPRKSPACAKREICVDQRSPLSSNNRISPSLSSGKNLERRSPSVEPRLLSPACRIKRQSPEFATPIRRRSPSVDPCSISPVQRKSPVFLEPSLPFKLESLLIEPLRPKKENMPPTGIRRKPTFCDPRNNAVDTPRTRHMKMAQRMFDPNDGRPSIMTIQKSGVVRQRIQQFNKPFD